MVDRLGQQIGNYRLLRLLGRGGFAEVYLGEHIYLKTLAAVKLLQVRLTQDDLNDFLIEARTIAHLDHPHIVRVLDFGVEQSTPFLVMPYAPHGSLHQHYPRGTCLPLAHVVTHVQAIASALQYAHDQGVIHRDVKPGNMLLGPKHNLLLSDFGVATVAHNSYPSQRREVGTVAYMAPERLRGKSCPASDQYALGVVVYEWLCGSRPFTGSLAEVALQHIHASPPPLSERVPLLSRDIEHIVSTALAKDPAQRYANIRDFSTALEQASQPGINLAHCASPVYFPLSVGQSTPSPDDEPALSMLTWNVPYRRNSFFTGREEAIQGLHTNFQVGTPAQPQALTGLAGVGKTQAAIEYAYRFQAEYRAILWARADSNETLFADFVQLAYLLNPKAQHEHDQRSLVLTVKRWLETQIDWLLIFDNVEDLAVLNDFIPPAYKGHILLTTRIQAIAVVAQYIDIDVMDMAEGATLLLRRAGLVGQGARLDQVADCDYALAKEIVHLMDGLPLALDQAGAYIEETACGLSDYIDRYRRQRGLLLGLRGGYASQHPESVMTTWLLSFRRVEQSNPVAVNLLRLCSFLHPDGIPEEMIVAGAPELGVHLQTIATDPHVLDAAIATLRQFSLVRRNPKTKMLMLHRLVQVVLQESMTEALRQQWAERVVRAVNRAFPEGEEVATWSVCQRYLPQVYTCQALIERWNIAFPDAARLLDQAGLYLLEQAHYTQAASLLGKALEIRLQIMGPEHPDVAESLNNLAGPYLYQGKYDQAEPLLRRSLEMRERTQGPYHPEIAIGLNNLALLFHHQGKYDQAEPLFERSLAVWEQVRDADPADVARTFNNLALLYQMQRAYTKAEAYYLKALSIWERVLGPQHPDLAVSLNNLAVLYYRQGNYTQAETLFQRVLAIREKTLGAEHPGVAHSLEYLATLARYRGNYAQAEQFLQQVLSIRRCTLGQEHPDVAQTLNDLARLYYTQGAYSRAEPFFREALTICEQALGLDHPDVAGILKNYAVLLVAMQRKDEAIQFAARATAIRAKYQHQSQSEEATLVAKTV